MIANLVVDMVAIDRLDQLIILDLSKKNERVNCHKQCAAQGVRGVSEPVIWTIPSLYHYLFGSGHREISWHDLCKLDVAFRKSRCIMIEPPAVLD